MYDPDFYGHSDRAAARSALPIITMLMAALPIRSVVDFGCGSGAWLRAWGHAGVARLQGVDGAWPGAGAVAPAGMHIADLSRPVDLGASFDLVQSLEVAEHLPPDRSATFVDTLVRHGETVLFSAAPPGQGGEHHCNERPYDFWRGEFARRGYRAYDFIRPRLVGSGAARWYRYNTLLFSKAALPPDIAATAISDGMPVPDIAPLPERLRRRLVRMIPAPIQDRLVRLRY